MDQRGFQVQVAQDQVLNVFYSFFGYTLSYHLGFTQDDLQLQIMYNVCILQEYKLPRTLAIVYLCFPYIWFLDESATIHLDSITMSILMPE